MQLPYRKPGKYSQIKIDLLLTEEKFNELKKDLEKLKRKQPQAAAEVVRLAELGDFSENVEYQLAKGKLRGINNAILKLEYQIDHAEIIKPEKQKNTVQIGHEVWVLVSGQEKRFQILGSSETNPEKGIVSYSSPLGLALLGHRVGEHVRVSLGEREIEYQILKIE
ncbi:MAG: Transcription elongation factor GreA [Candidatus Magasanikbacteria bacterium GW2011_GWC2_37_14]|uniref:Transcription elongation factor GreA n=1 Tax=Candidatus Magasanikbacteria bacterium GW2011_GWC2_37_14 TaxID=1619046 RepID=A0A0G0GA97_9BACT|nr:MAG: Transcription elongation factor GreA [Candidatus Magasanikbacteria bacterium GW2011_GWC2_37_14]